LDIAKNKKKYKPDRISIEFDRKHLSVLTTALEVYSRLRSGQIKVAMDSAFEDKELTYEDGQVLESFVRTIVFRKEELLIKNRNAYLGVGCEAMKGGTVAWEIKKAIQEYLHYERNDGYRDMGVDGDGVLNISKIPEPKILDKVHGYWKPEKAFRIPQRSQNKISEAIKAQQHNKAWEIVDKCFKNKPLPRGSSARIQEVSGTYYVIVTKPIKPTKSC
jgi:hypothetical protein